MSTSDERQSTQEDGGACPPYELAKSGEFLPSYDQYYFDHYSSGVNVPYGRTEPWLSVFENVADNIVQHI